MTVQRNPSLAARTNSVQRPEGHEPRDITLKAHNLGLHNPSVTRFHRDSVSNRNETFESDNGQTETDNVFNASYNPVAGEVRKPFEQSVVVVHSGSF
ncbi:hypothetical protein GOX01_13160 [Gluconobacter oxydans]|nr:hypothetical protein GOX01_13160 [Gluconobacter oxydans]